MTFDKEILSHVLRELEQLRTERANQLAQRRNDIYQKIPRIANIDRALSKTAAAVLYAALESGHDPAAAIAHLQEQNLALQKERTDLLIQHGYRANYLSETPQCVQCNDLGYLGSTPCECLKNHYAKKLTESLSSVLPIQNQNFQCFRLDYYPDTFDTRLQISPRDTMRENLESCKQFAMSFGQKSDNLLLFGSTGLGKTFLSTAIACEVTMRGYAVAYDTAIQVLSAYESVRFNAADITLAMARIRKYEQSDLLIIDDLGTEMSTQFNISALYGLISGRLMRHKSMIINTNLLPSSFEQRYSAAIASRLNGEFTHLRFLGTDIRMLKKRGL